MGLPQDLDYRARRDRWLSAIVVSAVAAGVVLRFWTTSQLWLDEALSVNIARLPLARIPHALRQDGSPPLYYFLLHFWIRLFGTGDVAVRALSGVVSVVTLPLAYVAGRRVRGNVAGWAAVALLAMSPFAIRYGTETRMYALLILLGLLGFLALDRVLRAPSVANAVVVSIIVGAILLTHYWGLYLIAVVGAGLLFVAIRRRDRASITATIAVVGGGVLFLPWFPTFLFHVAHTGTPWASAPNAGAPLDTIREWSGGARPSGQALTLLMLALLVLAIFGAGEGGWRLELDLRTRRGARAITAAWLMTLVIGMLAGMAGLGAFVVRYTAVAFPLFILSAAVGVVVLGDVRLRRGCLALAVVLGLLAGHTGTGHQRTQAGLIAVAIERTALPGDVVAYCPDQLGPATSRLLHGDFDQLTFPTARSPQRVDWIDYRKRNHAAKVPPFAQMLHQRAGGHAVYVVWASRYRTFGKKCDALITTMEGLRPNYRRLVRARNPYEERMGLYRFAA